MQQRLNAKDKEGSEGGIYVHQGDVTEDIDNDLNDLNDKHNLDE